MNIYINKKEIDAIHGAWEEVNDKIEGMDEEEHPELIREGNDLIYNLFISIPDAILGTHVEVPTVDRGFLVIDFCSIAIAGGIPSIRSTSGLAILPIN